MDRPLDSGFDPDWGWWVSADRVHRVYSSFSLEDALTNWKSQQAASAEPKGDKCANQT